MNMNSMCNNISNSSRIINTNDSKTCLQSVPELSRLEQFIEKCFWIEKNISWVDCAVFCMCFLQIVL
jgi:hypothetical protein